MTRTAIDIIERIAAPATLCCVGTDGGILRNRVDLPSYHLFSGPARPENISVICNDEMREILLWSNGFRLFDRRSYLPSEDGCAFEFFSAEDAVASSAALRERIALNMQCSADEWNRWFDENGRAVEGWINGLMPVGLIGEGGDILVLDTSGRRDDEREGQFVYLDFDMYAAGPFDAVDFDLRWGSLYDFWCWYESDIIRRLESTWRYTDQSGEQYFVERIKFEQFRAEM